jgi:hypothetical protein
MKKEWEWSVIGLNAHKKELPLVLDCALGGTLTSGLNNDSLKHKFQ